MFECTLSITHCLRLNLQLHTIDFVRTCCISSFCTVAWQLAKFQLTWRIVQSLGDSWASCCLCCVTCCKFACLWPGETCLQDDHFVFKFFSLLSSTYPLGLTTHTVTTHTHTRLMALFPGLPRWASTRKEKPILILPKQETLSGSGISWAVCKSAPRSRQITMPAPHYSFLQAGCPSCRPTNSVKALKAKHGDHLSGNPVNVMEFYSCQGNVSQKSCHVKLSIAYSQVYASV